MTKTRLTITLNTSLLQKIDQLVDGKKNRNRSHAIEQILLKNLKPTVQEAVILAGGQDETAANFRPLTIINGKPLIVHQIEKLQSFGWQKIFIATNKQGERIKDLLGNGKSLGVQIAYNFETTPLGTAGALKVWQDKLQQPFLVLGGDIWTDINYQELVEFHTSQKSLATIAVKAQPIQITYDNVQVQGTKVVNFHPSQENELVGIINTSIYLFEAKIFNHIPNHTPSSLEKDVLPQLSQQQSCRAFLFQGAWFDVAVTNPSLLTSNTA